MAFLSASAAPEITAREAHWEMEQGLEVVCSCTLVASFVHSTGATAQPILQPVIANVFDTPETIAVLLLRSGLESRTCGEGKPV